MTTPPVQRRIPGDQPRTYAIRTYGCQMNEHDSERIAGLLEADGLVPAADADAAQVLVLNTCCIRENADNKLYGALGNLKARREADPDLRIVVAGCLAQKDGELIRQRAPHVDAVLGTHNVGRVAELLHVADDQPVTEVWDRADDGRPFPTDLPAERQVGHAAWVAIQTGCDNSCAFCIVPAVRGPEVSRPFGALVTEVERLAADGVVEVTLLGQNVNSYGRDLTLAARRDGATVWEVGEAWHADPARRPRPLFADLLRAVGDVAGIRRVRFTSPHPKDLRRGTIEAMAEVPEVCGHLHLPLQSGSDRVLSAMRRGYTAARYLERLAAARAAVPDLAVSTDVIVGFPGETEDDFARTLAVCADAGYDSAFTFIYSPRPGTEASGWTEGLVPHDVAVERFERLRAVIERSGLARHRARIGRVEEVLIEGPSKRDPERITGRTTQNKLVHLRAADGLSPGTFATAAVTGAERHHLLGELVEITAGPRHRRRIPVQAL